MYGWQVSTEISDVRMTQSFHSEGGAQKKVSGVS